MSRRVYGVERVTDGQNKGSDFNWGSHVCAGVGVEKKRRRGVGMPQGQKQYYGAIRGGRVETPWPQARKFVPNGNRSLLPGFPFLGTETAGKHGTAGEWQGDGDKMLEEKKGPSLGKFRIFNSEHSYLRERLVLMGGDGVRI